MSIPSNQTDRPGTLPVYSATKSPSMELLYVWINQDETDFIKKKGFNFSPNYMFTMTEDADGHYRLSCNETPNYPNVWKDDTIVNLTAVVGENGTGKSSLLKHMVKASMLPIPHNIDSKEDDDISADQSDQLHECAKMVQIYRYGVSIRIVHNLDKQYFKNTTNFIDQNVSELSKEDALLRGQTRIYISNAFFTYKSIWDNVTGHKPIIFSPAGNQAQAELFFKKICGLNLLENPEKDGEEDDVTDAVEFDSRRDKIEQWDPQVAFRLLQETIASHKNYKDFERLCAISYYHHLYSEKTSTEQIISPNKDLIVGVANFNTLAKTSSYGTTKDYRDPYQYFLSKIRAHSRDNYRHSGGKKPMCSVLFYYLSLEEEYIWGDRGAGAFQEKHEQFFSEIYRKYYYDSPEKSVHQQIEELMGILGDNSAELADLETGQSRGSAQRVRLKYGTRAYNNFCKFIDRQMRADHSFILKYLTIEISPQSSGEQALQNVFSWLRLPPSFYQIFGGMSIPIGDNILLMLDEVDLYMHPEWQRQFLYALSKRLKAEYSNKHIQIIISTHSPLVLSDIPSGNIIYLKKDGEACAIESSSDHLKSFGANLFSLLKDSFFLEKSLGEFAHHTISRIINHLEDLKKLDDQKKKLQKDEPNLLKSEREYIELRKKLLNSDDPIVEEDFRKTCRGYRRVIDLIGEPMIRRKLQDMYEDLFPENDPTKRNLEKLRELLESSNPVERRQYQELLSAILPNDGLD